MLASSVPAFRIPEATWRGQAIRQYQPTGLEEQYKYRKDPNTKKQVLDYSFKQVGKTLIHDHYRALPSNGSVFWIWDCLTLSSSHTELLQQLLRRILYFGRAESFCRFELTDTADIKPNCSLSGQQGSGAPVLVPMPNADLKVLFAATDDKLIARLRIPPGTTWHYASIPPRPPTHTKALHRPVLPVNLNVVQFAVGGRVFPPGPKWVKVTERFRGRVLRICSQKLTGDPKATYRSLPPDCCDKLSLLSGKDGRGQPLRRHEHAYFCFWPDKNGLPTRLVCWRATPFTADELDALLAASEHAYSWGYGNADWTLKMVPLPFETPAPPGFFTESNTWVSVTPFVPPGNRRRFRSDGHERPGETPERLVEKLLYKCGYPAPDYVEILDGSQQSEWVVVHVTRTERMARLREGINSTRPGCRMRISFAAPVKGPLALGHSAHFGLGLFAPQD
jgi:CRISPR-associated protein Csb2